MSVIVASLLAVWFVGTVLFGFALCAAAAGPTPRPATQSCLKDFKEDPAAYLKEEDQECSESQEMQSMEMRVLSLCP